MRVLLTGATGFIGREVLTKLLAHNDDVRLLVRPETLARFQGIMQLYQRDGIEIVSGSMTDAEAVMKAHQGIEMVYHLAWYWKHSHPDGRREMDQDPVQINQEAAQHILTACTKHKVRRLVYTSSVAVYGPAFDVTKWPLTEETPFYRGSYGGEVLRNYVQPKIAVEDFIRRAARDFGFEYVILRPSIVYGVGWHGSDQWIKRALDSSLLPIWAGGYRRGVQMVHVRDMADAILRAGTRPEAAGREFNIAGSEVVTHAEIVSLMRGAALHASWGPQWLQKLPGLRRRPQRYDISKAETYLGFIPQVSLAEGLAELVTAAVGTPDKTNTLNYQAGIVGQMYNRQLDFTVLDDYFGGSDFWNWGYWDSDTKNQREACENLMEKLLTLIPQKQGTILDVACGKGATTRHLLKYYEPGNVTGINVTAQQLEICRSNAPGCRFVLMDATKLQFRDSSFDNIICVEAASHFYTRERFLREAYRVLKPGGRLVLSDAIFSPRIGMSPRQEALVRANYVRNAEAYRDVCLRAGFAEVTTWDTTEESWGGFSENFEAYLKDRLYAGTLDRRSYARAMGLLHWLAYGFKFYIVASCVKR